MHNYEAWRQYVEQAFIRSLTTLEQFYRDQIAPCFADLNKRADKVADEAWTRETEREDVAPDSTDPSEIAEDVFDEALDWYLTKERLGEQVNGLFCVAVWGQVERFLSSLLKEVERQGAQEPQSRKWPQIIKAYKKKGLHLEALRSFEEANVLRLVNNVVKHGEGTSLDELRKKGKVDALSSLTLPSSEIVTRGGQVQSDYVPHAFGAAREFARDVVEQLKGNDGTDSGTRA